MHAAFICGVRRYCARAHARSIVTVDDRFVLREADYRLIVETTSQGVWALDREGRTIFVNGAMAAMLGYSTDEIDGHVLWEFIPEAEQALALSNFEEVVGGLRGQLELRVPRKDGSKIWILVSVSPLVDEDGLPVGALGMATNIDERKRAEHKLRTAEERYRALAENLPLIMYQAPLAAHRPSTYISPQCEDLLGYTAEEWVTDRSLYTRVLHPEDRDRVLAQLETANRERLPFRSEYRMLTRDGRFVWVRDESIPVRSHGEEYALGFVVDVTARKASERRLEAQHHVASILAERPELRDGCRRILEAVCRSLELDVGSIWRVDSEADVLRHVELWNAPTSEVPRFEAMTRSMEFARGVGLPGRVWDSGEPAWLPMIEGDSNLPRASVALQEGLQAALCVPISVRSQVIGVIEFFNARIDEPTVELVQMMGVLGGQLGQFFERADAKDELVKAEERYRRLAEQLPLVTYIAPLDGYSPSIYVGPQIEELTGYSPEEWQSDPHLLEKLLHPDDRERVLSELDATITTRADFSSEYRLVARDGRSVWIKDESVTVHDEDGTPLYAQGYFLDVTERKEADEQLRESNTLYRTLLETANDAFVSIDDESVIVEWNRQAERLFGWPRDEAVGRSLTETVIPPEYRAAHVAGLRRFLDTGDGPVLGQTLELTALRRDGTEFPIELTIWASESAGRYRFNAFVRDISERKQLEEELRQAQKMEAVGRLAGGIAHDFNNLLLAIRGYAELALGELDRTGADGDLRDSIQHVKVAGERATALTGQLLAFGRKQVLRPEVVDLNALVNDIEGLARGVTPASIQLVIGLDSEPCPVKVDPGQMEQAIMNLVINARDAILGSGRITLSTACVEVAAGEGEEHGLEPGTYVALSVADTGMGMDEQTRARIFEPFFTMKGSKGTGLGLSTVYGFVKQSSGVVSVDSEPAQGSTFTIYLPYCAEPLGTPVEPQPGRAGRGSETVLLVEDESDVRLLLAKVLRGSGYRVLEAETGGDAIRLAETHGPIHVVVTDSVLPDISGREAVQRLAPLCPAAKIVHMSGYTADHKVAETDVFLQKPFAPSALAATIRRVLDGEPT
jgi:two-component system cell cycle sensor histidine kinase/response regulator CckA